MGSIDQHIIDSIKNGQNDRVLNYLYENTLKKVRKHITKNTGSTEEADDIFQDAVIIFFNQVTQNKYNVKYEVDGFIFTVAKNLWIDKMRREKKMVKQHFASEEHSNYEDHLEYLISREKTSAMRKVFEKLDEKCRRILYLSTYEKMSMKEISEKMGYSSEDVAKTTHYRCKQYLSKLVKEDLELLNLLKN